MTVCNDRQTSITAYCANGFFISPIFLKQLKDLTKKVGIKFTDNPDLKGISKEELILTLDEADADELKQELKKY